MHIHDCHDLCANESKRQKQKVLTCHLFVELLEFLLLLLVLLNGVIHFGLMPSLYYSYFLIKFILKGLLDLDKSRLVLLLQVKLGVLYLGHMDVSEA